MVYVILDVLRSMFKFFFAVDFEHDIVKFLLSMARLIIEEHGLSEGEHLFFELALVFEC